MIAFNCSWLNEDLRMFSDSINKFIDQEIGPNYERWEHDKWLPREVWNKLGNAGLLCVDIPEQYGGFGADFKFSAIINDIFYRRGFGAIAGGGIGVHAGIVAHYILNMGTETQKQTYLPKMVSGEYVGAIGMTEPGAGSDLKEIKTTATKVAGGYLINGSKTFISNGQHCDIVVLACKTDPKAGAKGVSLFIVETNTAGFVKGKKLSKLGIHLQDTSELFFNDMFVPDDAVLGTLNSGFISMMKELPRERLILAISAQAACEGMLDITLDYVKQRNAFGKRVADFQNTRFKLAELATAVRIQKAFVDQCVSLLADNQLDAVTAAMAKLHTTELQGKVADECLQFFGGYGYMTEYRIGREFVDARVQRIYGGTSEIMKEIIGKELIKD
ncbi:acyl-CoA dehydrogenase family protein [Thalassotalea psychrophila]|uniref:Acyl-CoA dehydrogenase family protein n=1 Tax=Thalassotalea psychrophila TaxID=3065647 RepID=A0ABY9U044_9GAMM|nr:acyl-CoA dehydrogenase family protein [Colwelliaceae bacterium SQ149]